jgi:hypothetical protein
MEPIGKDRDRRGVTFTNLVVVGGDDRSVGSPSHKELLT